MKRVEVRTFKPDLYMFRVIIDGHIVDEVYGFHTEDQALQVGLRRAIRLTSKCVLT